MLFDYFYMFGSTDEEEINDSFTQKFCFLIKKMAMFYQPQRHRNTLFGVWGFWGIYGNQPIYVNKTRAKLSRGNVGGRPSI